MEVKVVHCKVNKFDVYIGRPSKWGNKYEIGKDGDRNKVISRYRNWLLGSRAGQELLKDIGELKGKTLGCWCKPLACHGDVLIELANRIGE